MNHYFFDFPLYLSPSSEIPEENLSGLNGKGILIVLTVPDFLDKNQEFLGKILSAVGMNLQEDTHVLTLPVDQSFAVNELMNKGSYNKCLIFGVNPKDVGYTIETQLYKHFSISDKQYLISHSLDQIQTSTNYKKALWSELQQIFKV